MIILGLDIASTTGFSILSEDKLIAFGAFKVDESKLYRIRFKKLRLEVKRLIKDYKPKTVVLEGVYQGRNAKTTALLNNYRGIVMECVPLKSNLLTTSTSTARMEVLGQGKKHTKEDVFKWAKKKYKLKGLKFSADNDITDSILLSFWAHQNNKKI